MHSTVSCLRADHNTASRGDVDAAYDIGGGGIGQGAKQLRGAGGGARTAASSSTYGTIIVLSTLMKPSIPRQTSRQAVIDCETEIDLI